MKDIFFRIYYSLKYFFTKKNAINIHSPYLYKLYLKTYRINYKIPKELIVYEHTLSKSNDYIEFQSIGSNKKYIKTKIKKWQKRISAKTQKRTFIVGIAEYIESQKILELGSGFGITSALLSLSLPNVEIYTVEGVAVLNNYITNLKNSLQLKNLYNYNLDFNVAIDKFIEENKKFELIIIDGSHDYESSIQIINKIPSILSDKSIVILDDINYSRSMYKAWEKIIKDNEYFEVKWQRGSYGILIKNTDLSKQYLKV